MEEFLIHVTNHLGVQVQALVLIIQKPIINLGDLIALIILIISF